MFHLYAFSPAGRGRWANPANPEGDRGTYPLILLGLSSPFRDLETTRSLRVSSVPTNATALLNLAVSIEIMEPFLRAEQEP